MKTREQLVATAGQLRREIARLFADAKAWNDYARARGVPLIDPDPDGALRRMADGLDRMLAAEAQR